MRPARATSKDPINVDIVKYALAVGASLLLCSTAHAEDWTYESKTDPMTSKVTKTAVLSSSNELHLAFPYNRGVNKGLLLVRQHPASGLNVAVIVGQGQMLCRSYGDPCKILVRFDDKPPVVFTGTGPSDHSSDIAFFNNEKKFVESAKSAKTIRVQFTMYNAGEQLLEFQTPTPLLWP